MIPSLYKASDPAGGPALNLKQGPTCGYIETTVNTCSFDASVNKVKLTWHTIAAGYDLSTEARLVAFVY